MPKITNSNGDLSKAFFGTAEVEKIFLGSTELYSKAPAGFTASVTGLGNSSPTSQVYTRDSGFPTSFADWTDSNNNVFVKIPTMYRKIDTISNGQITAFTMATAKLDNDYKPYSVFVKPNGDIMPYVCIGKYLSTNKSKMNSVANSGTINLKANTISGWRTSARANGTGYQQYDWQFEKLFQDLALVISQNVNFNAGVQITDYLGIYQLTTDCWSDGVAGSNGAWIVATDESKYVNTPTTSTDGYTAISYARPTTSNEIMALGYDSNVEFFNYPKSVTSNSQYNTYYCDQFVYASGSYPVNTMVGYNNATNGLWYCRCSVGWNDETRGRLCYRPLNETI